MEHPKSGRQSAGVPELELPLLAPGRDSLLHVCGKWSTQSQVGSQVSVWILETVFHISYMNFQKSYLKFQNINMKFHKSYTVFHNSYMNFHESYVVFQNNYMNFQLFNLDPGRDCLLNVFGKWSTQSQVGS